MKSKMTARGSQPKTSVSTGEQIAVALAAAATLFLTVRIWSQVAVTQTTWPFPALYFIELAALALGCALAYTVRSPFRATLTWVTVGVLAAFSILGAWTVGLYYALVTVLFFVMAVMADVRRKVRLLPHVGLGILAAVTQAAAMLVMAHLF